MQTGADLTDAGDMGELKFYEKVKSTAHPLNSNTN
jgi:hypothetical protein